MGRPKKSEVVTKLENIEAEKESEIKEETQKKQQKKTGIKKVKMDKAEISKYIYLVFNFFCFIFKKPNPYSIEDFYAEAEALQRLAEKFSIITVILNLLNPVIIISGIIEKIIKIKDSPTTKAGSM